MLADALTCKGGRHRGANPAIEPSYGNRQARLLEAGLTLTLDLQLPVVLRRLVALGAELTSGAWCAFGIFGANGMIVDLVATGPAPGGAEPGKASLPPASPGVLRVPVRVRDSTFGDLCVAGKQDGPDFDSEDQRSLEILAAHAGVAIENATLLVQSERRARRLEALREVAAKLLAGSGLEELLELTATHAAQLARATMGTVLVPGTQPGTLVVEAVSGASKSLRGLEIPIDKSVAGQVIHTGKAEVVTDLASDPRAFQPAVELGAWGPGMSVPLHAHGEPFGSLLVARQRGEASFTDSDVELVEAFADQAAVAFEYARVHRELRRLAVMEERERIARELHDGAIQALFAVGMGLQATAARTTEPEVTTRLQAAVGELDRVIGDLRNYIFGLRPGVLAGAHVEEALRRLASEAPRVTTVVEVDDQAAVALGPYANDLVQLVREALSNVARHAAASTCRISLYWRPPVPSGPPNRIAVLEIDDDGRGFDPAATAGGHGLANMRARANALGGMLEIKSSASEGTTVTVMVPL
jgi:signal transduction histidine kinase